MNFIHLSQTFLHLEWRIMKYELSYALTINMLHIKFDKNLICSSLEKCVNGRKTKHDER